MISITNFLLGSKVKSEVIYLKIGFDLKALRVIDNAAVVKKIC